ncbi:hypothetical protein P3T37_003394 [Kitasatospora sp. MAA4]|uniref:hypothetical protein n=1 Tax=Kitasatospora sp. MAA4 TaxID=3035093 RepID=UPI0024748C85|nr:hypothetical protein [Kitasatospora sp. MAA4]MDH6133995.1 hypothetical protein [Kitasatospora sp. MAA4]
MDDSKQDGPLSRDEAQQFIHLLQRFCRYDLDQWQNWEVAQSAPYGPVYVMVSRQPPPDVESYLFHQI